MTLLDWIVTILFCSAFFAGDLIIDRVKEFIDRVKEFIREFRK